MLCYLTAMFIDKKLSGPQTDASNTTKNFVLVVFSLLFYAWGEPVYVFLMLFCVLMNYFVGRGIDYFDGGKRKAMLVVGLVVNISILGTFKYLGFFASVLNDMGVPSLMSIAASRPFRSAFWVCCSIYRCSLSSLPAL